MANAIPLLEGTDAAGGYLVSDTYGQTLQNTVRRNAAVLELSRVDRVPGKRQRYTVYAGRPTAAFVAEGAAKPVTGFELAEVVVDVKKIATIILYTEEIIEDAREDPSVLVSADVESAFADLIDQHSLGYANGAAIVGQFNTELTNTTQTTELGAGADALAVAVSAALEQVESNGGKPNGIVAAGDVRGHLRDQRGAGDNAANPVYTNGYNREPDSLYGLPIRYTSNLRPFATAAGVGVVKGIVGDFSQALLGIRNDVRRKVSTEATVDAVSYTHLTLPTNREV